MRAGMIVGFGMWAAIISIVAMTCTGCSGVELGGRLGVYRVDERQESQRTYRKPLPWKCYFTNCALESEEASGS